MARISPLVLLPPALFALLAGLFLGGLMTDSDDGRSALKGKPAPALPDAPLPGLPALTPEMLTDGQPKLVNFWASWCGPCRAEHPQITALAGQMPVYGVNYKDKPAQATAFLTELGNPYTAITQDDGRHALDWGVTGVPETFVLDGQGRIVGRIAGPVVNATFDSQLKPHLDAVGVSVDLTP